MEEYVLQVKNLTKYFGHNRVLNHVDLSVKRGEIHGIVGANGSGKSTLMNILFGNSVIEETGGYQGDVLFEGKHMKIRSPKEAAKLGIGMIHQEFMLIPDMSVAENIKLTREYTSPVIRKALGAELSYIEKKKDEEDAKKTLAQLGFQIDSSYLVKNISVNAKQFVEIAREVNKKDLKFLILDEPTAVLNEGDANKLLKVMKDLAKEGTSILFCTHRLHEICEVCDRVTVIRDGDVISTYEKEELAIQKLASDMIGYDVQTVERAQRKSEKETILEFQNFSVDMPGEMLRGINLNVKKGEILGLTSLSGHGKLSVGYGVMGMYPVSGKVIYKEEELDVSKTREVIQKGIFLLPDDRKNMGLLLEHSIKENIIFSGFYGKNRFQKKLFGKLAVRDHKAMDTYVKEQIQRLEIKCENLSQYTRELSGGNQQKVCIARAIAAEPDILFIMEPTRGVDIGAKEKILDTLVRMNEERGTTLVVASSELEELKRISDRIVVFCEGKISGILSPQAKEEKFALAYTGEEV